jgi:hypothetical protein
LRQRPHPPSELACFAQFFERDATRLVIARTRPPQFFIAVVEVLRQFR